MPTRQEIADSRNVAVKSIAKELRLQSTGSQLARMQARATPPIMIQQGKKTGWDISIGSYKNGMIAKPK